MIDQIYFIFDDKLIEEFINFVLNEKFEIIQGYEFLNKDCKNPHIKFFLRKKILIKTFLYKKEYGDLNERKEKLKFSKRKYKALYKEIYFDYWIESYLKKKWTHRCIFFDIIYSDMYNPVLRIELPYKYSNKYFRGRILYDPVYINKNGEEIKKPDICKQDYEKIKKWIIERTVTVNREKKYKKEKLIFQDHIAKDLMKYYDENYLDGIKINKESKK